MRGTRRKSDLGERNRSRFGREWEPFTSREVPVLPLPHGGHPSWALVFPSDYGTGVSNLGFHYVYFQLKKLGVGVERFFHLPIPNLSVENHRPMQDFPIITASIAYEPDALNFLNLLAMAGIPCRRKDRIGKGYPLIGAAGAFSSINPAMLLGIVDFIVLGDGEPVIPYLVEVLRKVSNGESNEKLLEALDEHPAILVPQSGVDQVLVSLEKGIKKGAIAATGESLGHGIWISPHAVFGETLLLELQRGCFRGCPYCVLPACFSPLRQRPVEAVLKTLEECAAHVPFGQVGLVTPEAGDYPGLDRLLDRLEEMGKGVSFASLRIDNLTTRMVRAMRVSGRGSLTIAPETGTDIFRSRCGKSFTNEQILDKLEMARKEGMKKVKLYFMIGLPGETEDDVLAIGDLAEKIRKETKMGVSLSVNAFVPKPRTPWAKEDFIGIRGAETRFALLKRGISQSLARGVEVRFSSPREADLEYRLSWAGPEAVEWMTKLVSKRKRGNDDAI